jgi:hypothetical protein
MVRIDALNTGISIIFQFLEQAYEDLFFYMYNI